MLTGISVAPSDIKLLSLSIVVLYFKYVTSLSSNELLDSKYFLNPFKNDNSIP